MTRMATPEERADHDRDLVKHELQPKNYRPMVNVNGREWAGNGLVFATKQEAEDNARELMSRWMLVTDTRADETSMPVNYRWVNRRLEPVERTMVEQRVEIDAVFGAGIANAKEGVK